MLVGMKMFNAEVTGIINCMPIKYFIYTRMPAFNRMEKLSVLNNFISEHVSYIVAGDFSEQIFYFNINNRSIVF